MVNKKLKLEYIWCDGYETPNLRSKTKVIDHEIDQNLRLDDIPEWGFDGSSTKQAKGDYSDCILKPVNVIYDPQRGDDCFLVMCEVMNPDGSPHESNTRALIREMEPENGLIPVDDFWFGFEQEYVLLNEDRRPLGFPSKGYPSPQGEYYCGVGHNRVTGRDIIEEHLHACLSSGLGITGINAEVMLGQWEYQVLGKGSREAGDALWFSRYLLQRSTEIHGVDLTFTPKPEEGDWNGSGLHTNFSNEKMREEGGKEYFDSILASFKKNHKKHIEVYGIGNEKRLTGEHETQSIKKFSSGVADRGASIRIPLSTEDGWKGYLEDRRPASNADPYKIIKRIIDTITEAE